MFRSISRISLFFLLIAVLFSLPELAAQSTITPEKQALIKELFEVTEIKEKMKSITDIMLVQAQADYNNMLASMIPDVKFLDEEYQRLQKEVMESRQRFYQKFRESFFQRIDIEQIIEQVYVPLYDKYFTAEDLQIMVTFNKTPTGQKALKIIPQLMQESMQLTGQLVNPKLMQLVQEILQQEKARLAEFMKTLKTDTGKSE